MHIKILLTCKIIVAIFRVMWNFKSFSVICILFRIVSTFRLQIHSRALNSAFILYADGTNPRRDPADDNIFSKFVKAFLPTPEDIGLKRYDRSTRPENYPATKTEWATLLPSDGKFPSNDMALIRQMLFGTNLETRPLQLIYSADRDGWKPSAFHAKVDKKGAKLSYLSVILSLPSKLFIFSNKTGPAVVLARSITGGKLCLR